MSETHQVPEHDLYEIARFVGISGDGMRRLLEVLKLFHAEVRAKLPDAEVADAARFRWLCDEQGLGFSHRESEYGISVSKWGDWPDDLRAAIDAARARPPQTDGSRER